MTSVHLEQAVRKVVGELAMVRAQPGRTRTSLVIYNLTAVSAGPAVVEPHAAELGPSHRAETARTEESGAAVDLDLRSHRPHQVHSPTS